MKISVVTVCYNSVDTLAETIQSVSNQTQKNIEHIVIDGNSTDGTVDIIRKNRARISKSISEGDSGIYDAMNKGIRMCSGDVIGFLNADDVYASEDILSTVANSFENPSIDACYGDLVYVNPKDVDKIVRYYTSSMFSVPKLSLGLMPAHPTLYLRKSIFDQYGLFETDYIIGADFELVARLFGKYGIKSMYIPKVMVRMRTGGISTRNLKSNWILNKEIVRACKINGIYTNMFKVFMKYPQKMFQLVKRPTGDIGYRR